MGQVKQNNQSDFKAFLNQPITLQKNEDKKTLFIPSSNLINKNIKYSNQIMAKLVSSIKVWLKNVTALERLKVDHCRRHYYGCNLHNLTRHSSFPPFSLVVFFPPFHVIFVIIIAKIAKIVPLGWNTVRFVVWHIVKFAVWHNSNLYRKKTYFTPWENESRQSLMVVTFKTIP